jgi:Tfp pilus assembly protein PilF
MIRGAKILLVGVSLAAAGCVATKDIKVRAIADPAAKLRFGGGLLAEGRAQLALGSVGLALETFRKLQREQPASADTFAGIAACYAAMGRYDIARENYEFALAYAPSDPGLLNALAASLDRLGEREQAMQVRAEAARLAAAPAVRAQSQQAVVAPPAVPQLSSVTVKLPTAAEVSRKSAEEAVAIAKPRLSAAAVNLPAAKRAVLARSSIVPAEVLVVPPIETAPAKLTETAVAIAKPLLTAAIVNLPSARPALLARPIPIANAEISIVTPVETARALSKGEAIAIARPQLTAAAVSLPGAHPAMIDRPTFNPAEIVIPALIEMAPEVTSASPRQEPPADKPRDVPAAQVAVRAETTPHMERMSTGEVALITNPGPVWVAQSAPRKSQPREPTRTDRAVAILNVAQAQATARPVANNALRWVPLRYASSSTNVQILNAARKDGLAARTRVALLSRGWRKIGIGNARNIRQRSVVLYSPARVTLARRLAAHFGCKAIKVQGVQNVVVLLGRDAAFPRPIASRT